MSGVANLRNAEWTTSCWVLIGGRASAHRVSDYCEIAWVSNPLATLEYTWRRMKFILLSIDCRSRHIIVPLLLIGCFTVLPLFIIRVVNLQNARPFRTRARNPHHLFLSDVLILWSCLQLTGLYLYLLDGRIGFKFKFVCLSIDRTTPLLARWLDQFEIQIQIQNLYCTSIYVVPFESLYRVCIN